MTKTAVVVVVAALAAPPALAAQRSWDQMNAEQRYARANQYGVNLERSKGCQIEGTITPVWLQKVYISTASWSSVEREIRSRCK